MISKSKTKLNRIKVLLFIPNVMKRGGIETFLMSYFRNMDKNKITFIFCQMCSNNENGVFDDEIVENGGFVEYLNFSNKHFLNSKRNLDNLLMKYNPDLIHVHGDADCVTLLLALRLCKAKNIISHSHNTNSSSNRNKILVWIKRHLTSMFSDYRFACSLEAGRWLFGKKQFSIIPNAIDVKKFSYSFEKRSLLRDIHHIPSDSIVVGCVGHILLKHKHQDYLVDIAKIAKENHIDLWICLVGDGIDFDQLKSYCAVNNINNVIFTGEVANASDYYSMFDVVALPSYYEGLGIACVEGICNGLFAVISDKVPLLNGKCDRECQIPTTEKLKIVWLNELCNRAKKRYSDGKQYIEAIGLSIEKESIFLFEEYKKLC